MCVYIYDRWIDKLKVQETQVKKISFNKYSNARLQKKKPESNFVCRHLPLAWELKITHRLLF